MQNYLMILQDKDLEALAMAWVEKVDQNLGRNNVFFG